MSELIKKRLKLVENVNRLLSLYSDGETLSKTSVFFCAYWFEKSVLILFRVE
jgi:hypothetical protein